ncbi:MAG TPA: HD domain-containing protein [Oscillatoriales cyanobacterium M59_W2019_021]|nr:MAG: HD domain-containing protein [Cyanobacteria bacterium J055]HIK29867.1 HD domain-containing protein [Oscillatoriales cyanobacterium M4454_W2019_049]HIK50011.1 HD domain-containing protein [Oscillatoriales cyanobacterium M59_W2019_021]
MLTNRFSSALVYAHQLHLNQVRKGSNIPYISHLLSVAALVLEEGGDEDEAIAALLHDAVEDCGGAPISAEIRAKFGERVARLVRECTESETLPKPPWKERKQRYLEQLKDCDAGAYRIAIADKLHNARSTLREYRRQGDAVWQKFKGGKEGTLWFYRSILAIQPPVDRSEKAAASAQLIEELQQIVVELAANSN